MKKAIYIFFYLFTASLFAINIYASDSHTLSEVAKHNNPSDCWMVINKNVYNLTDYLPDHDRELNIRSWCGTDATADYLDKNGVNRSHSTYADSLLNKYIIGTLSNQTTPAVTNENIPTPQSKYNVFLPVLITVLLYLSSNKFLQKQTHNFIWNSFMLLGLIPSFIFGIIMAASFNNLVYKNMLYHHVEVSLSFGTACILHLVYRFKTYLCQAKSTFN